MAERRQPESKERGEMVATRVGWRRIRWKISEGRRTVRPAHLLSADLVSREPDMVAEDGSKGNALRCGDGLSEGRDCSRGGGMRGGREFVGS